MNKNKLKEIIIAALVGAAITFLSNLLNGLLQMQGDFSTSFLGGAAATLTYLRRNLI